MLAAHMDQIGLMVTHIDEKGFMRFTNVGFIYSLASWGGQVRFADGTIGTVGLDGRADPRHKLPELRDYYIDVGAASKAEVKQKVGRSCGFWPGFVGQGNTWFSPNMDDRVGCIVLVQLLRELKDTPIDHDLYAVFTTQEEVGTRGARTSGYAHRSGPRHRARRDDDRRHPVCLAGHGGRHRQGRRDQGAGFGHDRPPRAERRG